MSRFVIGKKEIVIENEQKNRRIQALPKQLGSEIQLTNEQQKKGIEGLNRRLKARRAGTNNPVQASSSNLNLPSPSQTFVKELPKGWEIINNNGTYSYRNTIDSSIQSNFPTRPASEVANLRAQAAPAQQPQQMYYTHTPAPCSSSWILVSSAASGKKQSTTTSLPLPPPAGFNSSTHPSTTASAINIR